MLIVRRFLALLGIVFFFSCAAYVQNAKPSSYETAIDNSGESDTVIQDARSMLGLGNASPNCVGLATPGAFRAASLSTRAL